MNKLQLFHNLINLAAIDGHFTEEEIAFLAARAERWGISSDEFETAVVGIEQGQLEIRLPESRRDREQLLAEMIRLMAVDGELAESEKQLCATASARMDLSTVEFVRILDRVLAETKG
jgi:uncharacterized tellurite resistance protein B-like protein